MPDQLPIKLTDRNRLFGIDAETIRYSKAHPVEIEATFRMLKDINDELASYILTIALKRAPQDLAIRQLIFEALVEYNGLLLRQDDIDKLEDVWTLPDVPPHT